MGEGKLFEEEFPPLPRPFLLSQLSQIALRAVRIDGIVGAAFADRNEISNVAVSENAGWEMCDEIIEIADDIKALPSLRDRDRDAAVQHARTAKSDPRQCVPQIGAVVIDEFVTKQCQCGAVAVSDDQNTTDGWVGEEGREMRLHTSPALKKSRVTFPRRLHLTVRSGVKIQVVEPIGGAVARLKIDAQLVAASRKVPADLIDGVLVTARDTFSKQLFQNVLLHGLLPSKNSFSRQYMRYF